MTSRQSSRFSFIPREKVQIDGTTGCAIVDRYMENDCLLTRLELRRLRDHKYSSAGSSYLDDLCMKRFWEWIVNFYPLWLAPNVITLIGFLTNLATVFILSYYSPTASEDAPRWTYFLAAVGLFFYQTLDATDGKQARRTKSNSPLGELFDHGCDSISQIFVALNCCYALCLGQLPGVVFCVAIMAITLFYCAHWETYCSGQLRFSRYDVTEAQMTVIAGLLATAIFGPAFWRVGLFGIELRQVAIFTVFVGFLIRLYHFLLIVFTGGVGKNGSTVAGTSVISPLSPLLAIVIPFYIIYSGVQDSIYDDHITLFVLCLGAVSSKATNRLIVAHMCHAEIFVWDWIYLAPFGLMLNHYYNYPFHQLVVLYVTTAYAWASLLIYCYTITRQICAYLGIFCFVIPREVVGGSFE